MVPPPAPTAPRPSVLSEVRAWVLVAIAIFVHTVGVVWWAATLSADFRSLREMWVEQKTVFADHEQRLRAVEQEQGVSRALRVKPN